MKERDTFKSSKSFVKYKELRNKCKKEIKKAKSKYYINLIETNKNNQKFFQDLGSKIKSRKTINKLTVDGSAIDSRKSIGNELNQHFTTLIDKLIGQNENERQNFTILENFVNAKLLPGIDYNIPPISHAFVFKFLSSLKSSKAAGLDGISAKYLKMFAPYITDSIVKLCNVSIAERQFPDSWKIARVIPLFKKGSDADVNNYRPYNNNNLLHQRQSGFRYNHSCQTALTLITEEWLEAINNSELTGVLMVDLCKAFDLVDLLNFV